MSNIQKSKFELEIVDSLLAIIFNKYNFSFQLGDLFFCKYDGLCRLVDVKLQKKDEVEDKLYDKRNIILSFQSAEWKTDYRKDGIQNVNLGDFTYHGSYYKLEADSFEEFTAEVEAVANGVITVDTLLQQKFGNSEASQSSEVMSMNKDVLVQKKKELVQQQQFATARANAARALLEQRMDAMRGIATQVGKFIEKLNRLIWSIELYLGVKEELVQFGFGRPAPADDPICLRQRRLYMDIEMGDPTDDLKGIDFTNIEDFDNWLLKDNTYWKKKNYEILVPESKCVVIFKVRKNDKQYYPENPFVNWHLNQENMLTYVLIRNGENVFRIYADIIIGEKLFPDQSELENLVGIMNGEEDKLNTEWHRKMKLEEAEGSLERYKLNMILLQGIIERTPCFPDNQYNTSIFTPEGNEDKIKFIYDATAGNLLPTNIPKFTEWHQELNKTIVEGSRIFYISNLYSEYSRGYRTDTTRDRLAFKRYYTNDYNVPNPPNSGIYQVYKSKEDYRGGYKGIRNPLFIKYNPGGDRAWSWNDRYYDDLKRKNNLSFEIFTDDDFIINYDAIDRKALETLDFYLHTRIGREDYLKYIPILNELYKSKQKEMEEEDDFIRLCLTQSGLNADDYFELGVEAMEWWKLKNKWKRALTADDSKALRMIVKHIKSQLR